MKENSEALKVIGKRYMLWNIQRQVYALKLKDRTVTEEWLIDILDSLEKMQLVEEDNWDTKKYIESEIEQLHEQIDKMNSFMNDTIIEESEVKNENTEENQKKE